MECDIIIPVWNQLELTRECVESIIKNTLYPYHLIIIDNGSGLETRSYLEGLKTRGDLRIELIRNEENLGFVKAVNQGLKASVAPHVCIMNNDTIAAPGWLERMIAFLDDHREFGLVNPTCDGHGAMTVEEYAKLLESRMGQYMEMNQCQGFCLVMKRAVINKIGLLDEEYGIGGYDDTDYSMRAYLAGFRCAAVKDAYVYHRLHGSFKVSGNRAELVKRNEKIYFEKWGRHLRVGIVADLDAFNLDAITRVMLFSIGLAREWTWVHVWWNSKIAPAMLQKAIEEVLAMNKFGPHQNIRIHHLTKSPRLYELTVAGIIFGRSFKKSQKRLDAVVSLVEKTPGLIEWVARLTKTKFLRLDPMLHAVNWHNKGKEVALVIKQKIRDSQKRPS